jgi:hypothetical protein
MFEPATASMAGEFVALAELAGARKSHLELSKYRPGTRRLPPEAQTALNAFGVFAGAEGFAEVGEGLEVLHQVHAGA